MITNFETNVKFNAYPLYDYQKKDNNVEENSKIDERVTNLFEENIFSTNTSPKKSKIQLIKVCTPPKGFKPTADKRARHPEGYYAESGTPEKENKKIDGTWTTSTRRPIDPYYIDGPKKTRKPRKPRKRSFSAPVKTLYTNVTPSQYSTPEKTQFSPEVKSSPQQYSSSEKYEQSTLIKALYLESPGGTRFSVNLTPNSCFRLRASNIVKK